MPPLSSSVIVQCVEFAPTVNVTDVCPASVMVTVPPSCPGIEDRSSSVETADVDHVSELQ